MDKKRLLWVSDNPYFSYVGQSIVTRRCLSHLIEKYEVISFGFGDTEDKRILIDHKLPFQIYTGSRYDDSALIRAIERIDPHIIVFSHDAFLFGILPEIRLKFPHIKLVGWFTIDGHPIPNAYRNIFLACDAVVSPTEYGKNVIQKQFFDIPIHVIPYAVDRSLYFPIKDRKKTLAELKSARFQFNGNFEEKVQKDDTFVGVFWGHNQSKKNLSCIFESWVNSNLPVDKSHLLLVTHSRKEKRGVLECLADYDYTEYVIQYSDRIQVVEGTFLDQYMAKLVQLGNCVIFPSIGEGFGMPLIEGMSCGMIPITSNYAGATDFCRHGYNSLLLGGELITGELGVRRMAVSSSDLSNRIAWAYKAFNMPDKLIKLPGALTCDLTKPLPADQVAGWNVMSENAIETAQIFTWEKTAKLFIDLFDELFSGKFNRALVHTGI